MDKETAETLLNGHLGTCSADQLDCSFMVFGCSYEILPSVRIGPELGGAYDFRDVYFCKAHNAVHLCRDDICQGNCMTDSVTIRCAISGRALSDKIRSWPRDASLRLSEDKLLKLNDAVMSVWRETHAWTVPSYGHQCYRPSCAIDELRVHVYLLQDDLLHVCLSPDACPQPHDPTTLVHASRGQFLVCRATGLVHCCVRDVTRGCYSVGTVCGISGAELPLMRLRYEVTMRDDSGQEFKVDAESVKQHKARPTRFESTQDIVYTTLARLFKEGRELWNTHLANLARNRQSAAQVAVLKYGVRCISNGIVPAIDAALTLKDRVYGAHTPADVDESARAKQWAPSDVEVVTRLYAQRIAKIYYIMSSHGFYSDRKPRPSSFGAVLIYLFSEGTNEEIGAFPPDRVLQRLLPPKSFIYTTRVWPQTQHCDKALPRALAELNTKLGKRLSREYIDRIGVDDLSVKAAASASSHSLGTTKSLSPL